MTVGIFDGSGFDAPAPSRKDSFEPAGSSSPTPGSCGDIFATKSDTCSRNSLGKYRRTLKPSDNLLVYFAGHGYLDTDAGEGFVMPRM